MKKLILLAILYLFVSSGIFSQTYSGGNGTKQNPYLISSKADMETLNKALVSEGWYLGRYFLLTCDLAGITSVIGGGSLPFEGTFDGGGHTIDVYINNYGNAGVFGYIENATIKNLKITGSIVSQDDSGGICGEAKSSTISNCQNAADIASQLGSLGGICGASRSSTIINCLNTGNISSGSGYSNCTGGICGKISEGTEIIRCFALNETIIGYLNIGRIVGDDDISTKITDCYASPSMLVNRYKQSSQNASGKDGKDMTDAPRCSYTETIILLFNTITPLHWEKSLDDGATWENIECTGFIYTDMSPVPGIHLYRALNKDGSYSTIQKIIYLAPVPSTLTISPQTSEKIVGESITFTVSVSDTTNTYQWYLGTKIISGATSSSFTIPILTLSDAGNYRCVVSNKCSSATSNSVTLTVNKATQIIDFPEIPVKIYGDSPFKLPTMTDKGLTITYNSLNTSVATILGNVVTILKAGETDIIANQLGNVNYNAATTVTRKLTVNKASQTIEFNAIVNKTYGDADIILNQFTDKGLIISYSSNNEAVITVANNILKIRKAGNAMILAKQEGNDNYLPATSIAREITVNKADQVIEWTQLPNKTYGDSPFTLPAASNKGLIITYCSNNPDIASVSNNTVTIKRAGTVNITGSQPGNDNFNMASDVIHLLTINKAQLTIRAKNYTIYSGVSIPKFELEFSGFKGTDDENKLESLPTINCNATVTSPIDNYDIVLQGGSDKNYDYVLVNGVLKILAKRETPTITWATPADITYGTTLTNTQLCATANVAGTFKYSPSLGTKLNAGSGQTLSVNFTPTDTINYESVSKSVQINVKKAIPVITWSTPADIFNGDVLSSKQLNATANVTGTFTYSPAIGTKLNSGNGQILSTQFKASDDNNYELATKQVTINVIEPVLSVSAPTVNISFTGKETSAITINSNCPWIATSGQRWLTVSPSSGTGNGTILLSASENNSVFDRTAVVTIKGSGDALKTITVTQSKVLQIIANITRKWDDVLVCNNSEKLFINYQWYKNDMYITGETKQYYYQESGELNGSYYVKVTTSDGTSGISNTIDIINASRSIKAYPNPTENNQNFSLAIKASESDLKQAELTILSFSGQVVFQCSHLQQQMQLKGLPRGCYIIHIRLTDGELLNEKIMVN